MKRQKIAGKKGFSYSVSDEALHRWQKLSASQKLEWLEEANSFIEKAAPASTKRCHRAFRSGRM